MSKWDKKDYGKVWRDEALAEQYVTGIRGALPFASEQIEMMVSVIGTFGPKVRRFADLGCGDGVLTAAILDRFTKASAVLVDHSVSMLKNARQRFSDSGKRVEFVEADLAGTKWVTSLPPGGSFDAVVSGFAIHHLSDRRKRSLYAEIHDLLTPGGVFINIEHVSSPTPELETFFNESLVDSIHAHDKRTGGRKRRQTIAREYVYRPDKDANILASIERQCAWLKRIGYTHVDCYFKYLELAVFGGRKGRAT